MEGPQYGLIVGGKRGERGEGGKDGCKHKSYL